MTMFVKFPIEIFERDAFQNFSAQQEFSLGNGRAPGVWQTIATDAQIARNDVTDVHAGFGAAFELASGDVEAAVNLAQGKRLFITGHSLGGGLAALAAKYAVSKGVTPCAV